MVDRDPENKNSPDNEQNENSYSREEIEQSRAKLIDKKIELILEKSLDASSDSVEDEEGKTFLDVSLTIVPPEDYSVLQSYGYSRVELSRRTIRDRMGKPVYPWISIVESFDREGMQKEHFLIKQLDDDHIRIRAPDEKKGFQHLGSDVETADPTNDIERFDPSGVAAMLPHAYRPLEGHEYEAVLSLIIACEADSR